MNRSRPRVAIALAATIAAGLASRRWPLPVPFALAIGDALYATAVWFGAALVAPRTPRRTLIAAAFGLSALVEISQLVHWPWLDHVRGTLPGRLLLGQGFQTSDLLAYAVGVAFAWTLDHSRCLQPTAPDATNPSEERAAPDQLG